jgi:hypothetical protein
LKTYTVYRFDYIREISEPVGKLVERRSKERVNNVGSLLKLAQKTYPTSSLDSRLVITPD